MKIHKRLKVSETFVDFEMFKLGLFLVITDDNNFEKVNSKLKLIDGTIKDSAGLTIKDFVG